MFALTDTLIPVLIRKLAMAKLLKVRYSRKMYLYFEDVW